jgi:hypothetical protein
MLNELRHSLLDNDNTRSRYGKYNDHVTAPGHSGYIYVRPVMEPFVTQHELVMQSAISAIMSILWP